MRNMWCTFAQEVMAFQDLPFLPLAMQGRSQDSRQFPSHEEVLHCPRKALLHTLTISSVIWEVYVLLTFSALATVA